ncbi:haloacid dehalogenase type II [Pseudonocardia sp. KRD291]|uniref:haloacid dehalogenase type II n=1 Tax=Pseudonocardia sp. KRD291 TaxID=2792007 RepID=UPI001C4A10C9|nr:haloacid dehalogenase type II [Pseudonocardia sp. KRD291]MBW0102791.1 haloacid dehalogenase type II [Pseudonocardia sp. KRD291]
MADVTTVVFDVNETLSDMRPMAGRFADLGAPESSAALWFASTLREGIALAASGDTGTFSEIGRETAKAVLRGQPIDRSPDDAATHVLDGFLGLPLHPDVADGFRTLRAAGLRLVTLSNGGVPVAEKLLGDAGLRDEVEHVLSVDDAGIWKPARAAYAYAAQVCGTAPGEMVMVAVHPWDLHGAHRAGMRTAFLNRDGATYPAHLTPPDHTVTALPQLAPQLR